MRIRVRRGEYVTLNNTLQLLQLLSLTPPTSVAQPCPTTNDVATAVLSDTAVITVVEVHRDNDDTIIASHMDVDLNAENGE